MTLLPKHFVQAAWVVNDLEEAMDHWIKTARVGPFFVIPHQKVTDTRYRGTPTPIDYSGALAQSGPLQIELIQQHSDTPSAYRDTFPVGQEGFHHMCSFVDDYDAEIESYRQYGADVSFSGAAGNMRFAYIDTRSTLGFMTEIIEDRQKTRDLFKMVADAAVDWDGTDPIRAR